MGSLPDRQTDRVFADNTIAIFYIARAMIFCFSKFRKLNIHAVKLWNEMKIECMTHYQGRDQKVYVYIKSKISHRKSKWTHFILSVLGHSLKLVKSGKYRTPLDSMKGSPFYEELTRNHFTIDMNDSMPMPAEIEPMPASDPALAKRKRSRMGTINRLFSTDIGDGQILPTASQPGLMFYTMNKYFKAEWAREHCLDLQVPPPASRGSDVRDR